ncbi:MAG TPA: hypothetical protein VFB45_15440 [Pseudolabrys sp.]|nr:hypothetical protein [Pseudolabrys sp.]
MPRMIDNMAPDVRDDLAELAMKLAANADTRSTFLKAVKKVDPSRRFPSQDIDDLREEMKAKDEERKLEEQKQATLRKLEEQRASLGLSEAELKEVETVMTTYGLTDYEAARDLWQARKPPSPPADGPTATWTFPTLPNLIEDPAGAARNEAFNVITEIRRGKRAA